VAADDDGVGVVARMAPAPDSRFAHDHETGDLVDRVVHPARLEGGAVAAFVPAAVGRAAIEHAVADEERHAPPGAVKVYRTGAEDDEAEEPEDGIADCRA